MTQARTQTKPVLFVTGHAPPDRVGAFARLHEMENVEFALFGGRSKHGAGAFEGELPFPHRHIRQHEPLALAASGRYRAVICSSGGRIALGATWAGARRARTSLILWTSLWAHPRSAAHALSFFALRRLYRSADAVVTYGSHVSAYVSARGARNVHIAPQAVDNGFWSAPDVTQPREESWPEQADDEVLVCRSPRPGKGIEGAYRGLAYNGSSGTGRRARPRRRGIHSPLGPRRRRGGSRIGRHALHGSCPADRAAQPLRRLRRPGGALDPDAHVSRALGSGHQRGDEPRPAGDRYRRRRSRSRWSGARWAQRPGGASRRQQCARRGDRTSSRRSRAAGTTGRGRREGRTCLHLRRLGRGLLPCACHPRRRPERVGSFIRLNHENRHPSACARPIGHADDDAPIAPGVRSCRHRRKDHPPLHPRRIAARLHPKGLQQGPERAGNLEPKSTPTAPA